MNVTAHDAQVERDLHTLAELTAARDMEQDRDQPAEERSSLVVADLAGFAHRDLSPPQFALEPLVPAGLVTLLAAHGGAGKSILALSIAAHFALGRSWAGFTPVGGRVLFATLEDNADLVMWRLRKIAETHGLDPDQLEGQFTIVDGSDGDGALATEFSAAGVRKVAESANLLRMEELAAGAGLIVVDNASDAFDGDENARRQVRWFIRRLSQIARANESGLILLAHLDKHAARYSSNSNSYSGSTAWHNSVRSRLAIIDRDGQPQLVHEKSNLGPKADPVPLEWTDSGVLVPSNTGLVSERAELTLTGDTAAVLEALKQAHDAGTKVTTARTGPNTTRHVLSTFGLPAELADKSGNGRFWAAIENLRKSGQITQETYRDDYRHEKQRLVPSNHAAIGGKKCAA